MKKSYLFYGLFSGISFGITGVMLKKITENGGVIKSLASNYIVFILIGLFFGIFGFLSLQKALKRGKTGLVMGISNSFAVLIPIFIGIFIFKEILKAINILGVIFIMSGALILQVKKN